MNLVDLGAAAAALIALGALARGIWWGIRRFVFVVEAVKELVPNGGSSIKDTVTRTESKVDGTASKVDETARELGDLKQRFEEHLNGDC